MKKMKFVLGGSLLAISLCMSVPASVYAADTDTTQENEEIAWVFDDCDILSDEEITELISKNLKTGWTIDRISTVDLSLLKLAIYEIKYGEIPYKIAINEAVNLAKKYGEEQSPSFVNGILAKVVE